MKKEKNYDFLQRRRQVHVPNRRDATLRPLENEIPVDGKWTIAALPQDEPLLKRAALDLQDYLLVSMGISLKISSRPGKKTILLEKTAGDDSCGVGEFSVEAGDSQIRISSHCPRAVWSGTLRMEDLMNLREAPFVKRGSFASKMLVAVREVHSGCGIDEYPDWELSAIAHGGFNSITVFLKDTDRTTRGYCNINDLIRRAAEYGLDVYFYNYMPSFKHPDETDAETFFDSIYGELFKRYPGAKGISLCGESLEFPSRDPKTSGKRWGDSMVDGIPDTRPSPGWWPCEDYGAYLKRIEEAVHRVKPDAKITFSTYNWGYAELEDRRRFLEKIFPEKILLRVPFEVFSRKKIGDLSCPVMDYSVSVNEGSFYFKTECETASRRGIGLVVTTNTCGATWDFGTVPYVPAPYKWIERIRTLGRALDNWNIEWFYETHHYGWEPNIVVDLAKFSFRSPQEENLEGLLEKLAVRDYGKKAAPMVLKAWRLWSDAMDHYVASNEDQYGPWRVGPAYPFIFHPNISRTMARKEIKFPAAEHAHFGSSIIKTFYQPYENANQSPGPLRYPLEIEELKQMLKMWNEGLVCVENALEKMDCKKRPAGERHAALGRFIRNSIITVIHIKKWWMLNIRLQASSGRTFSLSILEQLEKIAMDEIKNAEDTIPAVECDSRLGWEPSMEYVCDPWHLEWKIRQVKSAMDEIKTYRKMVNL